MGAREASAMEGGVGCGDGDGMRRAMRAGRMARPGRGRRRRRDRDELDDSGWRGRAGLNDGGEIEDEQNRRSIYIHQLRLKDI